MRLVSCTEIGLLAVERFHSFREVHTLQWHAHRHAIGQAFLNQIISAAAASKSQPASASRTSLHPNIHALADFSYQNDGGGKEKTYRKAQCDQRMGGTRSPVQLK